MPERGPPKRTPPLFKVGDRIDLENFNMGWLPGRVVEVQEMTKEDLVRTAYAAGFWIYYVNVQADDGPKQMQVSGNVLRLSLIEQLGSLVDDD